ncbi:MULTISPECIES: DUF2789 domain-containing protein [Salinivibrio]|uniref:DUF2789 domain-containing protein n=1 Tax=Salinivibrio kushneri TaxID=1908198 RepID=A0AB36K6F1_9GAMM|nr:MULTISPECIES: DUF2789 domain-containing protein [Salinivibrio]ODP95824.1 hypothetical protein BGL48_06920 [Salinivibrio sp. BNH]OOE34479.1 hypothetical protein BZG04_11350 [Salinivibrio kushneri]OOE36420.1 hypothetical protein BZG05_02820 [Salinivibrio kushneri]OOE39052.1 hypothetical protein BZG00_11645 [Salinivibrio kushneri]OOE44170.1 hypothetical protein BZG09_08465 [Salinivibrio kushneri]
METFQHDLQHLFEQLGLATDKASIEHFLSSHCLVEGQTLVDAPFWSAAQRAFIDEAIKEDADWAEQVDMLDARLRKP